MKDKEIKSIIKEFEDAASYLGIEFNSKYSYLAFFEQYKLKYKIETNVEKRHAWITCQMNECLESKIYAIKNNYFF